MRVALQPGAQQLWFGGVMEVINQVTMLSIILTGAALIREREHGTIEHLLVMPVTPFEIMTGKVWANGLVVLVACALSLRLVVQGWLARADRRARSPLFLLGAALHLFATTVAGHLPRHGRPLDAAVRPADDPRAAAVAACSRAA